MSRWIRTTKQNRCPICGTFSWCSVNDDGTSKVVKCARVMEGAFKTGEDGAGIYYMHRLSGDWKERQPAPPTMYTPPRPNPAMAALDHEYRHALDSGCLTVHAHQLGVSVESLRLLGIGWCAQMTAFSFPMRESQGGVIGLRLRSLTAKKWALEGSHNGLFLPARMHGQGPLLITEGPTDTAALLTLGFDALGCPSNTGAKELVAGFMSRLPRPRAVVIVRNRDPEGSIALRHTLAGVDSLTRELLRVRKVTSVRVVVPPVKDAREWLRAGGTHDILATQIASTPCQTTKHVNGRAA